jgi:hypothetical protein
MSLNYQRAGADTSIGRTYVDISACISNTAAYYRGGFEYTDSMGPASDGVQNDITYAADTLINTTNNGTNYYYDEPLAGFALYYRSGWEPARTQARTLADYWLSSPWVDDGYVNVMPRNRTLTSVFASAALDGRTDNWYGLRRNATQGITYSGSNCFGDFRERAYANSWVALAAMLDPDPTEKAAWQTALATPLSVDNTCKGVNNDYKQYYSGGEAGGSGGGNLDNDGCRNCRISDHGRRAAEAVQL